MQLPQSSVAEILSRENISAKNLAIAHLGGEGFAYDKSTLQGPPLIHLSGNIERLFREWEFSDLFIVNGHGIPVKYWGEFFKKSKTHGGNSAWDSIKVEWGNRKMCHNHARQPDADGRRYGNVNQDLQDVNVLILIVGMMDDSTINTQATTIVCLADRAQPPFSSSRCRTSLRITIVSCI
ncbi:hypothetical protein K503DRAFT_777073 [Rhizopogon vinicolor AM-OR11-026]|uniref:Uncharacterized protein n=1 Tax=Rhizopogon vinicolor AM-OR11-026 TaxID=1314800 RepID=A0A1B7MHF5_9AGAM|nr:hypothetical protein K503DRAFT_777073 [Rhizopogon vinicolor AM-OR11-026]